MDKNETEEERQKLVLEEKSIRAPQVVSTTGNIYR